MLTLPASLAAVKVNLHLCAKKKSKNGTNPVFFSSKVHFKCSLFSANQQWKQLAMMLVFLVAVIQQFVLIIKSQIKRSCASVHPFQNQSPVAFKT